MCYCYWLLQDSAYLKRLKSTFFLNFFRTEVLDFEKKMCLFLAFWRGKHINKVCGQTVWLTKWYFFRIFVYCESRGGWRRGEIYVREKVWHNGAIFRHDLGISGMQNRHQNNNCGKHSKKKHWLWDWDCCGCFILMTAPS